jgi:hypothetical protein
LLLALELPFRSVNGRLALTGQYSGGTLYKRGTDEWVLMGDLS